MSIQEEIRALEKEILATQRKRVTASPLNRVALDWLDVDLCAKLNALKAQAAHPCFDCSIDTNHTDVVIEQSASGQHCIAVNPSLESRREAEDHKQHEHDRPHSCGPFAGMLNIHGGMQCLYTFDTLEQAREWLAE